jgi:hypothetical protein
VRAYRLHAKVRLWWGRWWAVQFVTVDWLSLGVHVEPRRPLVDLFLGPLTVALGRHPALTDPRLAHRHASRGFFIGGYPQDAVL